MPRWRRVLGLILLLWVVSTIAGAVCWARQRIEIDTTAASYRRDSARVDSLARGPLLSYAKYLRLNGWRIVFRADTLGGDTVAVTRASEPYRNSMIVLDIRKIDASTTDEVLLHELWHIKLSPYTRLIKELVGAHDGFISWEVAKKEEALVTDLTRMMLWR